MPNSAEKRAKNAERDAKKRAQQTSRASARGSKAAGREAYTNSEDGVCDIVPVSSSSPVVLHSNAATNIQPQKKKEEVNDVEEVKQPRKNPFAVLAGDSDED